MADDPSSYWSKALGFGPHLTPDVLDRVIGFYRESGVRRAVIQLLPRFAELAAARGLERGTTWIKLGGDPAQVAAVRTGLRIGPVPADRAREWAGRQTGRGRAQSVTGQHAQGGIDPTVRTGQLDLAAVSAGSRRGAAGRSCHENAVGEPSVSLSYRFG
jgi:hypothetical protein